MRNPRRAVLPVLGISSLLAALAGCQTPIPPYETPSDGNTARLLFRTQTAPGFGYRVYAFDDPHTCAKPLLIGTGDTSRSPAPSALRAGPLATLQYFAADQSRRSCRVSISFYPAPRHTYVLVSSQDSARCTVGVLDATDGERPRPVQAFPRRVQGRSGCAPLGQAVGTTNESSGSFGREGPAQSGESPSTRELDELKDLLPGK